jgi:hypothetical protein
MLRCPKCNTSLPEGMRFCLQCGVPLAAAAPMATTVVSASPAIDLPPVSPAAPPAPAPAGPELSGPSPTAPAWLAEGLPPAQVTPSREPTISLKIAPSVVIAPRVDAPLNLPRLEEPGPEVTEVVEEALRRVFERPPVQPGTVACRFCKGPLHLEGEYCEQCGAPVEDAAPPGVLKPKPQPAAPAVSLPVTAPAPAREMAQPEPSLGSTVMSPAARPPLAPPPVTAPAPAREMAQPAPSVGSTVMSPAARPPLAPSPATAPAPARTMAQPWPSVGSTVTSPAARPPVTPPPVTVQPAAKAEPMRRPLLRTRAPLAARPPKPKLAVPEPPPGLMGRLKGLLKTKKVNFPVRLP